MMQAILDWIFPQRIGQSDKAHYEYLKELHKLDQDLIKTYKEICAGHDAQIARCDWISAGQEELFKMYEERNKNADEQIKSLLGHIKTYENILRSAGLLKNI